MQHRFERKGKRIQRFVALGGSEHVTSVEDRAEEDLPPNSAWWQSILRGAVVKGDAVGPVNVVEAFCGPGGLGLGIAFAAQAVGRTAHFDAVIDADDGAAEVHKHNLGGAVVITDSVSSLVDYHISEFGESARFAYEPEILDDRLSKIASTDIFVAGPPCEGHSNLNNYTRRSDPRNRLYLTAVALGVALKARAILVENVPTVLNDKTGVTREAVCLLQSSGYAVSSRILKADELGAPQTRSRYFLLAWRCEAVLGVDPLAAIYSLLSAPAASVSWAIRDLLDREAMNLFDTPATLSDENKRRIDYLFKHKLYDLPDHVRPDCHKNGTSYRAVYGRLRWDKPAPTITTGFNTPGQGRNVHPVRKRVITPREAARLQGFPDWYDFNPAGLAVRRKHFAKWIGDAVHPMLGYAAGLSVLMAISAIPKDADSTAQVPEALRA